MSDNHLIPIAHAARLCNITFEHAWKNVVTGVWKSERFARIIIRVPMHEIHKWNAAKAS